jgi:hypothetical protein
MHYRLLCAARKKPVITLIASVGIDAGHRRQMFRDAAPMRSVRFVATALWTSVCLVVMPPTASVLSTGMPVFCLSFGSFLFVVSRPGERSWRDEALETQIARVAQEFSITDNP